jgi:hypothetical protein
MHTNVLIAQGTIPSSSVITNNLYLYSLGSSPICAHEVEKSLSFYPFGNVKTELIQGLNHGFKLQYNGPRKSARKGSFLLSNFWLTFVLSKCAYLAGVETCKSHSSISMSPHGV